MIKQLLKEQFSSFNLEPVSGGDINQAYKLETEGRLYFVKYNSNSFSADMFESEKMALLELLNHKIKAPEPYEVFSGPSGSCLLMQYIHPKKYEKKADFEKAGATLAQLHQCTQNHNGWKRNNYIGTLSQNNKVNINWPDFFIHQRINAQLKLAYENKYLNKQDLNAFELFSSYWIKNLPNRRPSCLHGDLWSGNLYFDIEGLPWFIDPALYYGHSEIDLAMTMLFGQFPPSFYLSYWEVVEKESEFHERVKVYQLYYLLVHLNLFGLSYKHSCLGIIQDQNK